MTEFPRHRIERRNHDDRSVHIQVNGPVEDSTFRKKPDEILAPLEADLARLRVLLPERGENRAEIRNILDDHLRSLADLAYYCGYDLTQVWCEQTILRHVREGARHS